MSIRSNNASFSLIVRQIQHEVWKREFQQLNPSRIIFEIPFLPMAAARGSRGDAPKQPSGRVAVRAINAYWPDQATGPQGLPPSRPRAASLPLRPLFRQALHFLIW